MIAHTRAPIRDRGVRPVLRRAAGGHRIKRKQKETSRKSTLPPSLPPPRTPLPPSHPILREEIVLLGAGVQLAAGIKKWHN